MRLAHRFPIRLKGKAISGAIIFILLLFGLTATGFSQSNLVPLRVHVGEKAPNFTLPSTSGKLVSLSSFRGHNVLIDFYEGYW